jgi:membrane protein implicated in regulation of membrane protease activity
MDALFDVLSRVEPMHWFAIGLLFLVAEVATGTTYLLWPAAAAVVTAAFAVIFPGNPLAHWAVFAVLTLALTLTGHFYVRGRWLKRKEHIVLNERAHTLVGQSGMAEAAFVAGVGRVKLDDTAWRATSADEIGAGERVEIVGIEGSTLLVRRPAA